MEKYLQGGGELDNALELSTPGLFGRETPCRHVLEAANAAADGRCRRLWIAGAPGTGKTALCEWAMEQAPSFSTVTVECVEGESDLALGVVQSVVRGLRRHLDGLPNYFRETLQALIEEGSSGGEPFSLATSLLALVALAAERQPLMLVLDDVQWIDPTSDTILGFVLRRLDADAVLVLAASRSTAVGLGLGSMAEVVELGGLSDQAAAALIGESGPMSALVVRAIVAATGGVPLAIKEIASQLTVRQQQGLDPLPEPLPVGERLLTAYQARLAVLDEQARLALGVAAGAGSSLQSIPQALSNLGLDEQALAAAEQARVVTLTPVGPFFSHPLLRTASLAVLSPAQRRGVHAALAAATQNPLERAVHLVQSCAGPSGSIADELGEIAAALMERNGAVSAAGVWREAGRLTPPGPDRIARLLRAGRELASVGRIAEAKQCLDEVVATSTDAIVRADAVALSAWLRAFTADAGVAAREAAAEAQKIEGQSPAHGTWLRATAAVCFTLNGDCNAALAVTPPFVSPAEPGERIPPLDEMIFSVVVGNDGRHEEAARWVSPHRVSRWVEALEHDEIEATGRAAVPVACFTLRLLERFDDALQLAAAGAGRARRNRQPQALPQLLGAEADVLLRAGRWREAEAVIHEAISLSQETGQAVLVGMTRALLARLHAARGQETYQTLTDEVLADALAIRSAVAESYALFALGLGHLSTGRIEGSVQAFNRLRELLDGVGLKSPTVIPYRADHIEALIRAGDEAAAREVTERFEADVERSGSRWAAGTCARVKALLPNAGEEADFLFGTSVQILAAHPFDLARTQLLWGEALRQRRELSASREQLNAAAATFDRLEAISWAERARRELRATGARTPRAKPPVMAELTSQEMQVAMTVADGNTNRETANRLFMSSKTVEHHLSAVYRKLGLRSRAELVRLVADTGTIRR